MSINFLHAEKAHSLMHHCWLVLCISKQSGMVISSWFRWDARASTSILVLYKLYGLSALVTWGGSDEIIETWVILQPLSFEICGLDTGLVILRQLGCGLGFTLNKLFFPSVCRSESMLTSGCVMVWIISSSGWLISLKLSLQDFSFGASSVECLSLLLLHCVYTLGWESLYSQSQCCRVH